MKADNVILIRAPLAEIYSLAAAVERWPEILPHYRYVRVREEQGQSHLVEMAARRGWIPVWWMAQQECDPNLPEIRFHHVRGVTAGMDVAWRFAPGPDGVRVREERARVRLVEMAARRGWIPVWWMAQQECDPNVPEIRFRHVRGVTTGMDVAWRFAPEPGGVRVSIHHQLDLTWPVIGSFVAERIIGPHFVEYIAARTLARIKLLAEASSVATPGEATG
jgi:ribosome-associated toxin RatA of RatAB toxin-antitoxin module